MTLFSYAVLYDYTENDGTCSGSSDGHSEAGARSLKQLLVENPRVRTVAILKDGSVQETYFRDAAIIPRITDPMGGIGKWWP